MADGLSHNRTCALSTVAAQITGTHTDFPVLFTAANLPAEMFDADGSYPAQDGGGDIRFSSDSAGTSLLPCEVVSFVIDNAPANGVAEIWVTLPNVRDSEADTIYVWWNTPSSDSQPAVTAANGRNAVWPQAVFAGHLNSNTTITDSSGTGDGTAVNAPNGAAGKIGNAVQMARSTDKYIDLGRAPAVGATSLRLSCWFKWTGTNNSAEDALFSDWTASGHNETHQVRYDSANNELDFNLDYGSGNNNTSYSVSIEDGAFHKIDCIWDGSNKKVYIDGSQVGTDVSYSPSSLSSTTDNNEYIGNTPHTSTDACRGIMDEVLIETGIGTSRNADWIATQYANQNDPTGFISVGPAQSVGGAVSLVIANTAQAQGAETVSLVQTHALAIAAAAEAQAAGAAALDQTHLLSIGDAMEAQTADMVSFSLGLMLAVDAAAHAQLASSLSLLQQQALLIAGSLLNETADTASLVQLHFLMAAAALQAQAAQVAHLLLPSMGAPADRTFSVMAGATSQGVGAAATARSIGPASGTLSITSSR